MSTLTLVRHGQAIRFQQTNAPLSPLGEEQAAKLAEFWLRIGAGFDEVHYGALPRQTRTAEVVADRMRAAGMRWPEAQPDPAWNEYDAPGVLQHLVPNAPRLASLAAEFEQARGGPDQDRKFQRMFEAAMLCWLEEGDAAKGAESWPRFRERVSGAIHRIMEGPSSRRVVVFTSGGVIGFAVHLALQAPPRSFLDVNWRIRNTATSEFLFDRDRFSLDSFNGIQHLEEPRLRTYR